MANYIKNKKLQFTRKINGVCKVTLKSKSIVSRMLNLGFLKISFAIFCHKNSSDN